MRSAKQRISSALILAVGASMLMGCGLPERNTQVKSIKIGVTLYDQYDAFLSELMEDFNTYAAAKEEETFFFKRHAGNGLVERPYAFTGSIVL